MKIKSLAFFSLKDNQQLERIQELSKIGITSLKVEGRLKSADYVYRVGTAYRNALDHPETMGQAIQQLQQDFGREKTGYFLGGDVSQSMSNHTNTGLFLGNILRAEKERFSLQSAVKINPRNRLLVENKISGRAEILKVEKVEDKDGIYWIETHFPVVQGSSVFMVSENMMHFPNRFPNVERTPIQRLSKYKIEKITEKLTPPQRHPKKEQYFIRIETPEWLQHIFFEDYEGVFLRFDKIVLKTFSVDTPVMKKNIHRLWIELPAFIGEKDLDFYATRCRALYRAGIRNFLIGHPSQIALLPAGSQFSVNENCYVFNDAASTFFSRQGADFWIFPLENDMANLLSGTDRNGIINMYFHPHLFYSRMPVKLSDQEVFTDENDKSYQKITRDGLTIIIPTKPVSLFPLKNRLNSAGFRRFLIDLSSEIPDRKLAKSLLIALKSSKNMHLSSTFNFKKELI